jgi:hypothetical protein
VAPPVAVSFVGLSGHPRGLAAPAGHVVLVRLVLMAVALLYRLGPYRPGARGRWVRPGSPPATLVWLIVLAPWPA